MRKYLVSSRFAFVLLGLAAGCSNNNRHGTKVEVARSSKVRVTSPVVAEEDRRALAEGNAAFAFALYDEAVKEGENVVYSPLSVSTALAMTYAGARGETETQMAATLRFTLPQPRLHAAMNELDLQLGARGEGAKGADGGPFRLKIVNATWRSARSHSRRRS